MSKDANQWFHEMEQHGSTEQFYNTLDNLEDVYLASVDANNQQERTRTMWLLKRFKKLF